MLLQQLNEIKFDLLYIDILVLVHYNNTDFCLAVFIKDSPVTMYSHNKKLLVHILDKEKK